MVRAGRRGGRRTLFSCPLSPWSQRSVNTRAARGSQVARRGIESVSKLGRPDIILGRQDRGRRAQSAATAGTVRSRSGEAGGAAMTGRMPVARAMIVAVAATAATAVSTPCVRAQFESSVSKIPARQRRRRRSAATWPDGRQTGFGSIVTSVGWVQPRVPVVVRSAVSAAALVAPAPVSPWRGSAAGRSTHCTGHCVRRKALGEEEQEGGYNSDRSKRGSCGGIRGQTRSLEFGRARLTQDELETKRHISDDQKYFKPAEIRLRELKKKKAVARPP